MFFEDYYWCEGTPKGIPGKGSNYEILTDPYGKRYLIALFKDNLFTKLIYDSSILDFRHLNPRHQQGWVREPLKEDQFLVRDREHIPLFLEKHTFNKDLPLSCDYISTTGFKIAFQKIFYTHLSDPFNGVILYDTLEKPVLKKEYKINALFEFTDLITEQKLFKLH